MAKVGGLSPFPESTKVWDNAWYTDKEPQFPDENASECGDDGTQAFFDTLMNDILHVIQVNKGRRPVRMGKASDKTKFARKPASMQAPTSLPVVGIHNTPAANSRKFDGYLSQCDRSGPLSITFAATELKGALPRHRGFPEEQLGEILDMATHLMDYEQANRPFMFTSIADGYRWQFFKITRDAETFKYQKSQVYIGLMGWRLFLVLNWMNSVPPLLKFVMDGLREIRLESVLGVGSSASRDSVRKG